MRRVTFLEVLGYLFKFIVSVFVILFVVAMFLAYEGVVQMHQIEKFAVEVKENIAISSLTSRRLFFSSEKLAELDGQIIEPIRSCKYGYFIEIECLEKKECEAERIREKYSFGYSKGIASGSPSPIVRRQFPAMIENSGKAFPAVLTVNAFDLPLTRLSCMIEKAYKTVSVQSTACIIDDANGKCFIKAMNPPPLIKDGDRLCRVGHGEYRDAPTQEDYVECKYLPGVDFRNFLFPADAAFKGGQVLKAIPLNKNAGPIPDSANCDDYTEGMLAREGDAVVVVLCVDDKL